MSLSVHDHLLRALVARTDGLGSVLRSAARPWCSVTFAGARHRLTIAAPVHAADWLTEHLDAIEFAIPGHIVADIALGGCALRDGLVEMEIEALTIEEG